MYKIKMLNRIADIGLAELSDSNFSISDEGSYQGLLLRSADIHSLEIDSCLLAVARAGVGVNNIPIDKMTERGVVVFNTPGANANGVKELTIAALLLSCRKIVEGAQWAASLSENVEEKVEKEKNRFVGPEIMGKKLGVIGLGAIGVMVANAAIALGMQVIGYDPYISVEAAWGLSSLVKRSRSLDSMVAECDFVTIHVPLLKETNGLINAKLLQGAKKGLRLVNLSRNGLVDNEALKQAIGEGTVAAYITDFPESSLIGVKNVTFIPHLGASTPESEDNCAVMACRQLAQYLSNGSIVNSVNFPNCEIDYAGGVRLTVMNRNVPAMIGKITAVLAEEGVNIKEMLNRNKGDVAYNIIDVDGDVSETAISRIANIEGIIRVRKIS